MRQRALPITLCLLWVGLAAACSSGGEGAATATSAPAGPVLNWDRDPATVVVRLDRLIGNEAELDRLNRLPGCTLYGDGHVVWVNTIPPNGEEVLEAYISELGIRAFLEFIIRDQKFYDIPDYAAQELPPSETSPVESITLNVNGQLRTIRSYRDWPNGAYRALLDRCRSLSDAPALFVPAGGWVRVFEVPRESGAPEIYWPPTGPFRMAEAAVSDQALWVTDAALHQLWVNQRQTLGQVRWLENGKTYRVAIQVPGVSRDSPPPPPGSETPTPGPTEAAEVDQDS